ncbi:MAG: Purine nucleoside phosphorylase 1 [bacterium ADurb.Bin425]|jgi:purine-nucleoside phosphorylase|nr:MAG: Purine nucleoside phosphorylase 1 [bacterium ADurb.Bin425]
MSKEGKSMTEVTQISAADAVGRIRKTYPVTPDAAVILGSGVNVLEGLQNSIVLSYTDLFGHAPSVAGHSGTLTIGRLGSGAADPLVAVFRGRFHLYEGYSWDMVSLGARTVVEWGVPNLFVTNAAGGLNLEFNVGDLMVLTGYRDHLSPKWKSEGLLPAVMAPATVCANKQTEKLLSVGAKLAAEDSRFRGLRQGVYAGLLGPSYETMAEIDMLRKLQCDAVGMSTVPELLVCETSKTACCAVSVITNVWKPDEVMGGHEEVLEASKAASRRLDLLFRRILVEK